MRSRTNQKNPYGASVSGYAAVGDGRELVLAEHLDRRGAHVRAQVELDLLGEPGQVGDAQERLLALERADERQHVGVLGLEELDVAAARAPASRLRSAISWRIHDSSDALAALRLDVDALVVEALLGDQRQVEAVRVARREAGVAVGRPLHRRAHAVAVAEVDVVAHPDLVAVVDDRRARAARTAAR